MILPKTRTPRPQTGFAQLGRQVFGRIWAELKRTAGKSRSAKQQLAECAVADRTEVKRPSRQCTLRGDAASEDPREVVTGEDDLAYPALVVLCDTQRGAFIFA